MAGGVAAAAHAPTPLGLMEPGGSSAFRMPDAPNARRTPHIAILGAGIAGLAAAYELERAGYRCTILEASHRIGGRCFTVRRGTVIDEIGARQTCEFDDAPHLYFNAGPARIPGAHRRLLGYCRALGVPLEPFVNVNYNAWIQSEAVNGGRPVRHRQVKADIHGFLAEIAAKALRPASLDAPLTEIDRERLQFYLQTYGDLDDALRYDGSGRAGRRVDDMLAARPHRKSLAFRDIVSSDTSLFGVIFGEDEFQAPPLMQPVGGMDRIVDAFAARISGPIRTRAMATAIQNRPDGVTIRYEHKGDPRTLEANYVLNSIPGPILQGLDVDFDAAFRRDLARMERGKLSKLGIQFAERFWEREGIYGGISWTDHDVLQLWYPSHGAHEDKGVMLGAYIFFLDANDRFARMSHDARFAHGLDAGEAIHPGAYRALAETSVSIAWQRMNHLLGCATGVFDDDETLARLRAPQGRHYLIGDQVSRHPGWQEGALASAHAALVSIAERERALHG